MSKRKFLFLALAFLCVAIQLKSQESEIMELKQLKSFYRNHVLPPKRGLMSYDELNKKLIIDSLEVPILNIEASYFEKYNVQTNTKSSSLLQCEPLSNCMVKPWIDDWFARLYIYFPSKEDCEEFNALIRQFKVAVVAQSK